MASPATAKAFHARRRAARRSGGAREFALSVAGTMKPRGVVFSSTPPANSPEAVYLPVPLRPGQMTGAVNKFEPLHLDDEEEAAVGGDAAAAGGDDGDEEA